MTKNKDPNYAVKIEQAIAKNYGDETVVNPKSGWDDEKEKEYLDQLKDAYMADVDTEDLDKEEVFGVFIPSKLLKEESERSCPVCNTYSFKSNIHLSIVKVYPSNNNSIKIDSQLLIFSKLIAIPL